MIHLDGLAVRGTVSVTLQIAAGEVGVLVAPSQDSCRRVVSALLGIETPASGSGRLMGHDTSTLSRREAQQIFRQVGVVWREGGLISNLSLGWNAVLPATYHGRRRETVERDALRHFRAIGLPTDSAFLGRLPASVSSWQRRLVGLVRAWLVEPQVMICDGLLEDLPRGHSERVAEAAADRQRERPATVLHVVTDATVATTLQAVQAVAVARDGAGPPVTVAG